MVTAAAGPVAKLGIVSARRWSGGGEARRGRVTGSPERREERGGSREAEAEAEAEVEAGGHTDRAVAREAAGAEAKARACVKRR